MMSSHSCSHFYELEVFKVAKAKTKDEETYSNAHGVDLTAQVKKGGKGSIKLAREISLGEYEDVDTTDDLHQDLVILGEGFRDGEVVLNFDRLEGDSMNTRISAQAVDGKFRALPPVGFLVGTYRITAYVPQETVKGTDAKRVLEMVDQTTMTISKHRV
jgi:hypothetical protein